MVENFSPFIYLVALGMVSCGFHYRIHSLKRASVFSGLTVSAGTMIVIGAHDFGWNLSAYFVGFLVYGSGLCLFSIFLYWLVGLPFYFQRR